MVDHAPEKAPQRSVSHHRPARRICSRQSPTKARRGRANKKSADEYTREYEERSVGADARPKMEEASSLRDRAKKYRTDPGYRSWPGKRVFPLTVKTRRWRRQSRANSSQPNSLLYRENTGNFIGFGLRHPNPVPKPPL